LDISAEMKGDLAVVRDPVGNVIELVVGD